MIELNPKTLKFIAVCEKCGDASEYTTREHAARNSKKCVYCRKPKTNEELRAKWRENYRQKVTKQAKKGGKQ